MARIIRVFGKADSFDIELSRKGDKWEVDVPPDITDGVYACQLTAINELGESAYWVGELFMCSGVCHIKIRQLPYRVRVSHRRFDISFTSGRYKEECSCSAFDTEVKPKYISCVSSRKVNASYEAVVSAHLTRCDSCTKKYLSIGTGTAYAVSVKIFPAGLSTKYRIQTKGGCRCDV